MKDKTKGAPAVQIHVVERGQTVWALAQMYGVSVAGIVGANGLSNPDWLSVGEALVMPTPASTYIVQPGDSLWAIAGRYATTASALAAVNRIENPNLLRVGQRLTVPRRTTPIKEVNTYITQMGTVGEQTVAQLGPQLTYVSPFSHHVGPDGSLSTMNTANLIQAARTHNVSPLLVITNWSGNMFSSDLAHAILNTSTLQQTLISNVLDKLETDGYRGLNIDFEYVYPKDKDAYNQFLQNVVTRLRPEGYLVSSALAPKVSADQTGLLYEAHDYPVHGELCDFVVLMTYEWGWAGGPPWAIAPIHEVEQVLNYAVTAIERAKILMGVPVYGRDWKLPFVSGQSLAETFSPQAAVRRAWQYGVDIQYDRTFQAPYYHYTDLQGSLHEVWFEDARSLQAKLDACKAYNLRGISFWSYPTNFPQVSPVLANRCQARKLS